MRALRRFMAMSRRERRDFLRDKDGAVAVEFAFIALPFLFMLFAILEIGLVFIVDTVLENAVLDTGRLIRTGQAEAQGFTKAKFIEDMCGRMSVFSADCPSRVSVDVRVIPQFNTVPPDPVQAGVFNEAATQYTNGAPGDLVLVRVWYRHPLITGFLSQALSRLDDGTALLQTTTAFKNEPA